MTYRGAVKDEATPDDSCPHCGKPIQSGTIHHQVGDGSCVIETQAQLERSEAMQRTVRRPMS